MTRPDFPYRKLPGVRRGILSGASLWLGNDHILHVRNTRFAEDYRRYYFTDIEAIYLQKTARFLPPPAAIIGVIAGVIAVFSFSFADSKLGVEAWLAFLVGIALYAVWLCVFRSCVCSIQTALGTDRLSCLHRVSGAVGAISQITDRVLDSQGPDVDYAPDEAPAEPIHQPRPKGRWLGWLTVPFVLLSAGIVIELPVPIPNRSLAAALLAILGAVVCAVLALIAGHGSTGFRAIRGVLLAQIAVSGLELYAMVMVNTYSRPAGDVSWSAASGTLANLVWAAHKAGAWLAGADIAVGFALAVLLFRNPPRGNPLLSKQ
jgi:hypothetical protein